MARARIGARPSSHRWSPTRASRPACGRARTACEHEGRHHEPVQPEPELQQPRERAVPVAAAATVTTARGLRDLRRRDHCHGPPIHLPSPLALPSRFCHAILYRVTVLVTVQYIYMCRCRGRSFFNFLWYSCIDRDESGGRSGLRRPESSHPPMGCRTWVPRSNGSENTRRAVKC